MDTHSDTTDTLHAPPHTARRHSQQRSYSAREVLQLLKQSALIANQARTIETALRDTLDLVCSWTGWPVGHVFLQPDAATPVLTSSSHWHIADHTRFLNLRSVTETTLFPPGYGRIGEIYSSGLPLWSPNIRADPQFVRAHQGLDLETHAFFAFPVIADGIVSAVCEFFQTDPAEPDDELLEIVATIGVQLGQVFERSRARRPVLNSDHTGMTPSVAWDSHAISDIAGVLSHRVNNPLFAIRTNLTLLGMELPNGAATAYLATAQADLARIAETMAHVHQLATSNPVQRHPCRLAHITQSALDIAAHWPYRQQIALVYHTDADPVVAADTGRIRSIILHLLGSAMRTLPHSGQIGILLGVNTNEAFLEICGTPSQTLISNRLESFAATDTTDFGFIVDQYVVEKCGGALTMDYAPGGGCVARLTLPLLETADSPVSTAANGGEP